MKLLVHLATSSALIMAVSTARAADPIVAEPEPMDYVKVCDMYGAGFFYIPGTETCLRISGYVDVQYEYSTYDHNYFNYQVTIGIAEDAGIADISEAETVEQLVLIENVTERKHSSSTGEPVYLARVNFDAREETDLGVLRSYVRLEGEGTNEGGGSISAKDVYIELGGFSTGYRTTALETGGLPGLMLDGYYGGGRHMFANYTFAANGFAMTAGVDLDDGNTLAFAAASGDDVDVPDDAYIASLNASRGGGDGESVNPYIVASYSSSMFNIRGKFGYDTSADEHHYGVDGSITPVEGLTLRGYWEGNSGANEYGYNSEVLGYFPQFSGGICECNLEIAVPGGGEDPFLFTEGGRVNEGYAYADQTWGVGATYQILSNLTAAVGYSKTSFDSSFFSDWESYVVGLDWNVTDNLLLRANYRHQEVGFSEVTSEIDELRVRLRRTF